jgi:anti-sigma factor RsiW
MTDSENRAYTTHDSALLLLPWHVNGSLDDEQRKMVDSHLAVCLTCRSELNNQHRITQIVQSRDATSVRADIGFAKLRRRIQPEHRTLFSRVRDWSYSKLSAPAWVWASGVAVAASVFMALPLLHDPGGPATVPGEFRTLSADNGNLDFHANSLRLVFSAGIEDEIRQDILRMVNPVAVTAPSSRGVLTVQVPDGELASALALLRDRKEVRLAEPVFSATETAGSN